MNVILKRFTAIALSLSAASVLAAPVYLTTHNNTDEESNAFVAGTIPSPYPTPAHDTRQVYWNLVRIACHGHSTGDTCSALIKMKTNTANPVEVGYLTMNLKTGDITPKTLTANGYTVTVNGIAEASIAKN